MKRERRIINNWSEIDENGSIFIKHIREVYTNCLYRTTYRLSALESCRLPSYGSCGHSRDCDAIANIRVTIIKNGEVISPKEYRVRYEINQMTVDGWDEFTENKPLLVVCMPWSVEELTVEIEENDCDIVLEWDKIRYSFNDRCKLSLFENGFDYTSFSTRYGGGLVLIVNKNGYTTLNGVKYHESIDSYLNS